MDNTFGLINELVKSLIEDKQLDCESAKQKKYRTLAYEILLRKGKYPNDHCKKTVDPLEEINIHQFELKINSNNEQHELLQVLELQDCMNDLENSRLELTTEDYSILTLLAALRQTKFPNRDECLFLAPVVEQPRKKYSAKQNNYVSDKYENFLFSRGKKTRQDNKNTNFFALQSIQNESYVSGCCSQQYKTNNSECSLFTSNIEDLCVRRKPRVFDLEKVIRTKYHYNNADQTSTSGAIVHNIDSTMRKFCLSWEYLGQKEVTKEQPFVSETNSILHLISLESKKNRQPQDFQIIKEKNIIDDIKNLLVGVDSQTFVYDDVFKMTKNFTVDGINPRTFNSIIVQFMEIGTCFKRLKIMIKKNPSNLKLIFDGFIFKAFCECVDNYLWGIFNLVLAIKDDSMMKLLHKVNLIRQQIIALAKFCGIHPEYKQTIGIFPTGSLLLDYLYRQIIDVTNSDIAALFIYILKKCCFIYFSHFRTWIFQGHLEDNFNELFIYHHDHYRPNTKYYFDRAYAINKAIVPGFLRGFEEDILLCGKYTMLLKMFNPTHPLLSMRQPQLRICMSHNDKEDLHKECLDYIAAAKSLCGNSVSVTEIYQSRKLEQEKVFKLVIDNCKRNMEKWKIDQQCRFTEDRLRKQKQLQEQINEIDQRKLAKKKADINYLYECQQENDKLVMEDLLLENFKLQETVASYQELNKMMDVKQKNSTQLLKDLEIQVSTQNQQQNESSEKLSNTEPEISPQMGNIEELNGESQKNKQHILGSTLTSYLTDDYTNSNVAIKEPTVIPTSERQRNKMKILNQKFGFEHFSCPANEEVYVQNYKKVIDNVQLSQDFENNNSSPTLTPKRELTDLEKNRIKMMNLEYNTIVEEDRDICQAKPTTMYLNLNTDRAVNRRKVLESEFDILTGNLNSYPGTPMSVDSDALPSEEIHHIAEMEDINANILEIEYAGNLPETSMIIEDTPEYALNNKGINLKEGFIFPNSSKSNNTLALTEYNNIECDENLEVFCSSMARNEMNFFNIRNSNDNNNSYEKNKHEIDASTLIKFLQNSLTVPLNAHMDILNNEILKIFLNDLNILGHFESLKNYFLLMDGEFGSNICDSLFKKLEEVQKPSDLLNYHTLHSILDDALCSSSNADFNSEGLSFIVEQIPEKFDMYSPNVFSMLNLSYRVEWPLLLILNPETIEQYTNIFKYLVKVRRIGWVLEKCFQLLKETHKLNGKSLVISPEYQRVQLIRHKLSHFINALNNYITSSALQASWENFKNDLETVFSMEDLYRKHTNYIKRILFLCLLKKQSKDFYNNIEEIFKVCLRFYKNLKSKVWRIDKISHIYHHSKYLKMLEDETDFEKLIKYTIYLAKKMINYGYQKEISDFVNVININGYYSC